MKQRQYKAIGRILLLVLLLALLCLVWLGLPALGLSGLSERLGFAFDSGRQDEDWRLILVNDSHRLPRNYHVELTLLDNGEQVDERIYPDLQAMFDAARADGLQLFVAAGYRTREQQRELLRERTEAYREEGCSRSEARRLARQWVARPGTSEHQLGIAVDVNADLSVSTSDEVYAWLQENSYKYGFINRYPPDKTEITGIVNEPWHYRYVGCEAAAEITSQGLCLEEYLRQRG
ncbi:MAG: M15 family metallopeptidase [Firmicutes bacterium]|nr:M15 family metallopeptidase [Bacillota bacterium]